MQPRSTDYIAIGMFIAVLFCNSVLFGISRHIGETMGVGAFQVMFFYCWVGLLGLLPIVFKEGVGKVLKTTRWKLYGTRALLEMASFSITIFALSLMTMPAHTALSFATPIIGSITAVIILKEQPTHHTWVALALGVLGVLAITQPWNATMEPLGLIMLLAGLGFALCGVSIKLLTSTESSTQIAFYMLFLTGLVAIPFAFNWVNVPNVSAPWVALDATLLPWVVGIGICSLLPQILVAKAYQRVPITTIIPLNFLMLIFSSIIAYFFFAEVIELGTIIGAIIIIAATLYSTYGSSRKNASAMDEPIV